MADLIDRKAALASLVKEYSRRLELGEHNGLKLAWIEKAIDDTPPVQQWTPIKERKPNQDERVLFQLDIGGKPEFIIASSGELRCLTHASVAWMPLPEPYEVKQ